jgi:hypothetical protein
VCVIEIQNLVRPFEGKTLYERHREWWVLSTKVDLKEIGCDLCGFI